MNTAEFIDKYIHTKVDFDGHYGCQCVDLVRLHNKEVNNLPHTGAVDGAKEMWTKWDFLPGEKENYIRYTDGPVSFGDYAVWDGTRGNPLGHVAIVVADLGESLVVFEQDGLKQDGAKINTRSKYKLLGYLTLAY